MASKKGKTICIFSAKGGVGKTILTTNLAGICEKLKRKTLIIDLDLTGGGLSVALNRFNQRTIYHLVDDLSNNRRKDYLEYVTKYDDYIDILASPRDPRQGNKIDAFFIDNIIEQASYLYDVVLIDMSHVLNDINLVTLDKVDKILFLMTNDPLELKNMKSIMSIFRDLNIDKYKVILNNSRDTNKNYFSLFDIKNIIKANIDYTISPKFHIKNIDSYIMNGQIVTLHPRCESIFAKDYLTMSTMMIDILGEGLVARK